MPELGGYWRGFKSEGMRSALGELGAVVGAEEAWDKRLQIKERLKCGRKEGTVIKGLHT